MDINVWNFILDGPRHSTENVNGKERLHCVTQGLIMNAVLTDE